MRNSAIESDLETTLTSTIRAVVGGGSLSEEEAYRAASTIMHGQATPAQIGGLLVALRMKGEVVEEIIGFVRAMREQMTRVEVAADNVIDTCGTGGDAAGTFNISTVSAFVAAGAGVRVAKHGNRAISSRCGSTDALEALGVRSDLPPPLVGRCIDEIGLGFLFAPLFHPALRPAVGPRREIGIRSILNLAGPLANPASARRQIVGVFDGRWTEPLAQALDRLGSVHCLVVHGEDGLDEITLTGATRVSELREGRVNTSWITPQSFGLSTALIDELRGGDAERNAEIALRVLHGEPGPARDIVLLNAGAAVYVAGDAETLKEGIELAARSIDSGAAIGKLQALREFSQRTQV